MTTLTVAPPKVGLSLQRMLDEFGVDVDENLALEWLATYNVDNRNMRPRKLRLYTSDFEHDRWYDDGTPLRFGADGRLYDGQHRLRALVEASRRRVQQGGEPVVHRFVVFTDLAEETREVTDNGIPRSFADRGMIAKGVAYASGIAPVGHRIYNWMNGVFIPNSSTRLELTDPEFAEFYREHEDTIKDAAYWGGHLQTRTGLHKLAGGLAHYAIRQACDEHLEDTGEDIANLFFHCVATGADMDTGHPAMTLRETVNRRRRARTLKREQSLYLIISAWNAFAEERTYLSAPLPDGALVTNNNLPLVEAPNSGWTGAIYRKR